MKLRIDVTQDDIDQGERCSRTACMVYRAIQRRTEGALNFIEVAPNGIWDMRKPYLVDGYVREPDVWFSPEVNERVLGWDNGKNTEPFSFDLELPDELATGTST